MSEFILLSMNFFSMPCSYLVVISVIMRMIKIETLDFGVDLESCFDDWIDVYKLKWVLLGVQN